MKTLIENFNRVPVGTRILALAIVAALITGLNWYFVIDVVDKEIATKQASLAKLNGELVEKKKIADNINQLKKEKELLERKFAEALTEMPAELKLDELLRQLSDIGRKSGLQILNLEPGKAKVEGFYASVPIKMQVTGNFHETVVFFESVAKLRRIVNIGEFSFGSPAKKSEKVVLTTSFLATTYQFVPRNQADSKTAKKPGQKSASK